MDRRIFKEITTIALTLTFDRTTKLHRVSGVEEVEDSKTGVTRMNIGMMTLGLSGEMTITCKTTGDSKAAETLTWRVNLCMIRTLVETWVVVGVGEEEEGEGGMTEGEEGPVETGMMGILIHRTHSIAREIGTKDQVIVTLIMDHVTVGLMEVVVVLKEAGLMSTTQGEEGGEGGTGETGALEGDAGECHSIVLISIFSFHFVIHVFLSDFYLVICYIEIAHVFT